MPPRRILHLDVDAFLASVEQALHPELRGKAVVVGGLPTDRNLVMSCSYESRRFGVRPGLLLGEAARRCPHAVFRRGDSQAANRLREEVARIAWDFSPRVEIASIDDLFVDLSGTERHGRAFDMAEALKQRVADEVHLPLTIGVGTSRTLARLAGKLAKPGGVAEIFPGCEKAFLRNLPVEQLPGVGHSTARLLERFAIRTVGDLGLVSREVLFASFGTLGLLLHDRARGIDPDPVTPTFHVKDDGGFELTPPKSIRRDSTFEPEEGRREVIESMLGYLVERAAHRARRFRASVGSIEVRLLYVDTRAPSLKRAMSGKESYESRYVTRRKTLEPPTDSTDELIEIARGLLASLPRKRALVKRVGLTFHRLRRTTGWQGRLFSDPEGDRGGSSHAERHRTLDATLDRLREKHGFGGVLRGDSALLKNRHAWKRDGLELRTPSLNQ